MQTQSYSRRNGWGLFLVALLAAGPATAQTVRAGTDAWSTAGDGSTNATLDFPAGFFCGTDPASTVTIPLQGAQVAVSPANDFGNADTLVQRLNDATFDANGNATVQIVVMALHFQSTQNLTNSCGTWKADVTLDGPQDTTSMSITQSDANGGTFLAPISVRVAWKFTRTTDGATVTLRTGTTNILDSTNPTPWRYAACSGAVTSTASSVKVDTDGDGVPDTYVKGTSNFYGGYNSSCQKVIPCRSKNVDPAAHCYQPPSPVSGGGKPVLQHDYE